jgi:beta-lactamase class A
MKKLVFATFAALLLGSAAGAGEITFPSDAPVATLTIPDDWSPKETETGVDATSPDDAVYLSADVADAKSTDAVVKDALKYLQDQGVTVDAASAKQTEGKLNGMPMFAVDWTGTDKDGPVSISLAAVTVSDANNLIFTYWGTKGDEDADQGTIGDILKSLKPAK